LTGCEILAIESNQPISCRWNASSDEAANGLKTFVTWTLTSTKGGTHVRMEESGFRPEEQNYQRPAHNWQRFLGGLERVTAELK
jgi:uncharacterized protein YndB with AHSA1/START domain